MTEIPGRPLYEQIATDLRIKIDRGTYPVGGTLPSTSSLMREYGASITAVRAAVDVLKREGVVVGQPGKGVYVQRQPQITESTDLRARIDHLAAVVRNLTERVAELERGRAPR